VLVRDAFSVPAQPVAEAEGVTVRWLIRQTMAQTISICGCLSYSRAHQRLGISTLGNTKFLCWMAKGQSKARAANIRSKQVLSFSLPRTNGINFALILKSHSSFSASSLQLALALSLSLTKKPKKQKGAEKPSSF